MSNPSNPFHVYMPKPPRGNNATHRRDSVLRQPFSWVALLAMVASVLLLVWFGGQNNWSPEHFKTMLLPGPDQRLFVPRGSLDRAQARTLYRQALESFASGDYDTALAQFKQLESVYPGLQDMLWLHQADAYVAQGNEWAVQKKLNTLLEQHRDSALQAVAWYRLGQSQFRGRDWEPAQKTFEQVRKRFPQSEYAKGSLYYLAAILSKSADTTDQAVALLHAYLTDCLDCRLSGEAATLLSRLRPNPTPQEHAWLGQAFLQAGQDNAIVVKHLEQAPLRSVWLPLAKVQLRLGNADAALRTLMQGLPYAADMIQAREGVDLVLAQAPGKTPARTLMLARLRALQLPMGGDYVLWKSSEVAPHEAMGYYQQIVQAYPQGDYAPESAWRLLWPLWLQGRYEAYQAGARAYLERYPYARSASKALFWLAKAQEKTQPEQAIQSYRQVLELYPTSYYAFRATGRLKALVEHKPDPGWRLSHALPAYPPALDTSDTPRILPPSAEFGSTGVGERRYEAAQELLAIGATEDVKLLVSEATGQVSPAIRSWAEQRGGNRAPGIRVMRDALEARARTQFEQSADRVYRPVGTLDELRLVYPVHFSDEIAQMAGRARLDPYLVQSLMREESYFHEFAISSSNALGLMQLLPSTAAEVAGWEKLTGFKSQDLFVPAVNTRLGTRYLAHLHELFNQNAMPAVGAYNGGPNAMKRWIQASAHFQSDPDLFVETIPYEESRQYIIKVFGSYWNYVRLYGPS